MIEILMIFGLIYLIMFELTVVFLIWDAREFKLDASEYLMVIMFGFFWWVIIGMYIYQEAHKHRP